MANSQAAQNNEQYLRKISLIVYGTQLAPPNGIDLSNLRIKFSVKQTDSQNPNTADIRVYNLTNELALAMLGALNPPPGIGFSTPGKVILGAGYQSNFGTIFAGDIKQIILGRESATDTFVDIVAGDGHLAYAYSVISQPLAAGSTPAQQLQAAANAMAPMGPVLGYVGPQKLTRLPRSKVMYGNARNYMRAVAQSQNQTWSIQNNMIQFVPKTSYKPGQVVNLNSKTGLIGTPQQTNEGINIKCLLNPMIPISGRVGINEATVETFKISLNVPQTPTNNPGFSSVNTPSPITADGNYYVMTLGHTGDTRGTEWYTEIIGISTPPGANPVNSVQTSFGP
jgi:hypothetical protein